jgi:hypothetical protein
MPLSMLTPPVAWCAVSDLTLIYCAAGRRRQDLFQDARQKLGWVSHGERASVIGSRIKMRCFSNPGLLLPRYLDSEELKHVYGAQGPDSHGASVSDLEHIVEQVMRASDRDHDGLVRGRLFPMRFFLQGGARSWRMDPREILNTFREGSPALETRAIDGCLWLGEFGKQSMAAACDSCLVYILVLTILISPSLPSLHFCRIGCEPLQTPSSDFF